MGCNSLSTKTIRANSLPPSPSPPRSPLQTPTSSTANQAHLKHRPNTTRSSLQDDTQPGSPSNAAPEPVDLKAATLTPTSLWSISENIPNGHATNDPSTSLPIVAPHQVMAAPSAATQKDICSQMPPEGPPHIPIRKTTKSTTAKRDTPQTGKKNNFTRSRRFAIFPGCDSIGTLNSAGKTDKGCPPVRWRNCSKCTSDVLLQRILDQASQAIEG